MAYDLAVCGNVVVDVIAPVSAAITPGHQHFTRSPVIPSIGGNGANTAVAAAWLGLRTELYGGIGDDLWGRWLTTQLKEAAPSLRLRLVPSKYPTSASVVIGEASGDRTPLHSVGAGIALEGRHLPDVRLREGRWLHLCSTFLLPRLDAAASAQLLARAQRANMVTSVDLAWDPSGRFELGELPRYTDLLLANLEEGIAVTGAHEEKEVLQRLLDSGPEVVVLKLGAAGCLLGSQKGESFHVPPFPAEVVDSTGAGDVFSAAMVAFLLQHLYARTADRKRIRPTSSAKGLRAPSPLESVAPDHLKRAALLANAAGAICVGGLGGLGTRLSQRSVLDFLRKHRQVMQLYSGSSSGKGA